MWTLNNHQACTVLSSTANSCISELFKMSWLFFFTPKRFYSRNISDLLAHPWNIDPSCRILADDVSDKSKCQDVFLLQDEEEDVYKRDFSAPTLEDHFNKTILPKVMQVSGVCFFLIFIVAWTVSLNIVITALCSYGKIRLNGFQVFVLFLRRSSWNFGEEDVNT